MTYYVINSDTFEDRPYLRIAYDIVDGKLKMMGYSAMADWSDATLFLDETEARHVMVSNNPKKESLKLSRIDIEITTI